MTSSKLPQTPENLDAIFTEISNKLENVITAYRSLALENEVEAVRDKINESCDELEELRETISDTNQGLTVRTQCVNNICDNIDNILLDIDEFLNGTKSPTRSEKIITAFDHLKTLVGVHNPEASVPSLETHYQSQNKNENYFLAKKAVILMILTANPELNTDEL